MVDIIRTWIYEHIPQWRPFEVATYAEYLGILMGPAAAKNQWTAPLSKYFDRSHIRGRVWTRCAGQHNCIYF